MVQLEPACTVVAGATALAVLSAGFAAAAADSGLRLKSAAWCDAAAATVVIVVPRPAQDALPADALDDVVLQGLHHHLTRPLKPLKRASEHLSRLSQAARSLHCQTIAAADAA